MYEVILYSSLRPTGSSNSLVDFYKQQLSDIQRKKVILGDRYKDIYLHNLIAALVSFCAKISNPSSVQVRSLDSVLDADVLSQLGFNIDTLLGRVVSGEVFQKALGSVKSRIATEKMEVRNVVGQMSSFSTDQYERYVKNPLNPVYARFIALEASGIYDWRLSDDVWMNPIRVIQSLNDGREFMDSLPDGHELYLTVADKKANQYAQAAYNSEKIESVKDALRVIINARSTPMSARQKADRIISIKPIIAMAASAVTATAGAAAAPALTKDELLSQAIEPWEKIQVAEKLIRDFNDQQLANQLYVQVLRSKKADDWYRYLAAKALYICEDKSFYPLAEKALLNILASTEDEYISANVSQASQEEPGSLLYEMIKAMQDPTALLDKRLKYAEILLKIGLYEKSGTFLLSVIESRNYSSSERLQALEILRKGDASYEDKWLLKLYKEIEQDQSLTRKQRITIENAKEELARKIASKIASPPAAAAAAAAATAAAPMS